MNKQGTTPSLDKVAGSRQSTCTYPQFPFWLVEGVIKMPDGFAAIVHLAIHGQDTVDFIRSSCKLNACFSHHVSKINSNDTTELQELVKETNFRCTDIQLHRNLPTIEKLLVLGLASHCHYVARAMVLRFNASPLGLGISILLSKLSSTFLAREYELLTASDLKSPPIINAMMWAGSMLVATSSDDDPMHVLGKRLLRLCGDDHTPDGRRGPSRFEADFIWPETLPSMKQCS